MPRLPATITQQSTNTGGIAQGSVARPAGAPNQQTANRQVNDLQRAASTQTARAAANPLGDCNYFTAVTFGAGTPTVIAHGLGRAFRGALAMTPSAGGPMGLFIVAQNSAALDALQVTLQNAYVAICDILVF